MGLYRNSKIEKDVLRSSRFKLTLQDFGIDDDRLANDLGDQYIQKCPLKNHVFPFTFEVLDYLKLNKSLLLSLMVLRKFSM